MDDFDDNEGIDNSFVAFGEVETYTDPKTNYKYYKKPSLSNPNENHGSVNVWNYLYGSQQGALLKLQYDAVYLYDEGSGKGYDYFPELGIDVPQSECLIACYYAQINLQKLNYYHTDLNNCNNVKKVGNGYYPIDTNKIFYMTTEEERQQQQQDLQQLVQQYQQQQQQQQQQQYQQQSGRKRKSKKIRHRKSKKNKTYKLNNKSFKKHKPLKMNKSCKKTKNEKRKINKCNKNI